MKSKIELETENGLSAWECNEIRKLIYSFEHMEDCPPEYIEAVNDNFEDLI